MKSSQRSLINTLDGVTDLRLTLTGAQKIHPQKSGTVEQTASRMVRLKADPTSTARVDQPRRLSERPNRCLGGPMQIRLSRTVTAAVAASLIAAMMFGYSRGLA